MKLRLLIASCFLSANLLSLDINPAQAGSPVQTISSSQAQGLTGTLPTITVWEEGGGTNLDFIPTEEKILQAWLDDLSQVTLDCNGSLCNPATRGNRNISDTTVFHLRRTDKPINFPGIPQTASTLLSVITETSGGKQKLYQFRIAYGNGNAEYHTVRIEPDTPVLTASDTGEVAKEVSRQLQNIQQGLQVAKDRNLLGNSQRYQQLEQRVQNFLALVSSGKKLPSAAAQSGLSISLVNKLAKLGETFASSGIPNSSISSGSIHTVKQPSIPGNDSDRPSATNTIFPKPRILRTQKTAQQLPLRPVSPQLSRLRAMPTQNQAPPVAPIQPAVARSSTPAIRQQKVAASSVINKAPKSESSVQNRSTSKPPVLTAIPTTNKTSSQVSDQSLQAIDDANAAAFGLTVAKYKGQINTATNTYDQAQGAIRQLRLGESREEAARRSGLDIAILTQLIKWGQNRP